MILKGIALLLGLLFPLTGMNFTNTTNRATIVNPGATYETQRVWITNYSSSDEYKLVASYDSTSIDMVKITNSYDSKVYYYADIPYQLTSVTFQNVSVSDESVNKEIKVQNLLYGVCYYLDNGEFNKLNVVSASHADISMLALAVEAYLTYGKDDSNGCTKSTVRNLYNTWFAQKSASKEEMKNIKIWDYTGYAANGNSYEGLVKNAQFSVNEKWNTMCSQAGIDPNTGLDRNDFLEWIKAHSTYVIVGGIGLVVVIGGFIFLVIHKKRKEAN